MATIEDYEAENARVQSEWYRANCARDSARIAERLAAERVRPSKDPAFEQPQRNGTAAGRAAAAWVADRLADQGAEYRARVTDERRHAEARVQAPQRPLTPGERAMANEAKRRRAAAFGNDAA